MIVEHDGRPDLDLAAIQLTDAQREALAIDRHLVVSAGAGSGKTHTLAWRYVRLLLSLAVEGESTPEGVLVLTFTEKAAQEMSARCEQRLQHALPARTEGESSALPRFRAMSDRFQRASILTFHAFCARIAREFPGWVGIAADARVLEPDEALGLRREVAARAVDELVRTAPERLGALLDTFGSRRALLGAIDDALDRHGVLRERLEAHRRGAIQLSWDPTASATARDWLVSTGLPTLRAVRQLTRPGGTRASQQLEALCGPAPSDDLEVHRRVQQTLSALLNATGGLRQLSHPSLLGVKRVWRDLRRHSQARAALQVLQERCADWPERFAEAELLPTPADAQLLEALQPFAELVEHAHRLQLETFEERRVVDFDRLLDGAVDAVQAHPPLRAILRKRHRYLMVDEFQDTDPRQWQMVRLLGDADPGEPADRIFLVGDVKQAIYGFRGGEVRLFHEAAAHLGVEPIELPDNFRTRPEVVDWFNQMLPRVLTQDWRPIVAGRSAAGGTIRWLEAETLEDQTLQLCSLLRASTGQVAVLFRTRTHLGTWEQALRRADIPYEVAKGVGFWERPEIRDAVNLTHALVTGDPLSWVGVWRSPLLGCTEQEVQDALQEGLRTRAMHAAEALGARITAIPLTAAIDEALTALGAWEHWSPAARANVELLLARIQGWDESPVEIAARLSRALLDGVREGEAPVAGSTAKVVLMTVHASKGLEFDTVVLPELERPVRSRPAALSIAHLDGEWCLAATVDDRQADLQARARPALLTRVRRQLRIQADAEADRLLYVALTRTRDHLVLLGPREGSRGSWADRLFDPPESTEHLQLPLPTLDGIEHLVRWEDPPTVPIATREDVVLTATDLAEAAVCATRWLRRRLGGAPEPRSVAAVFGTVLHGLIEDRLWDDRALAQARWQHQATVDRLSTSDAEQGWTRLDRALGTLRSDPVLAELLALPGFDELALRTPFPGGVFLGRIDRLALDRDRGGFVVVDYKTQRAAEPTDAQIAQLRAYAWAANQVLEAHDQPVVVGGTLYFTGDCSTAQLGPWDDLAAVEAELVRVAALVDPTAAWAHSQTQSPPCESCALFGSSCPGVLR